MAPKTRIWSAPAYLPGVHPSPSRRKIQRVESILGVTLPPILLEHLKAQNGGHIRFELPGRVHNRIVGLSPSYPSIRTLLENMDQERTNAPLKGLIPFDGDGHWYICLDYNGKPAGAPAVVWVEMDDGTVETIASSFEDYLGMLRIKRAQELLVLDPVPDPQRLLEALGAALGCTFETTTRTYGSGTTHKASVEGPEGPQWLWLQPNEVARAFVYPHENAPYPALAHWLTERRLCHPEISAQGMLMGLGDALRPQVMEACRGLGLEPTVLGDCIKPDWEH